MPITARPPRVSSGLDIDGDLLNSMPFPSTSVQRVTVHYYA